MSDGALDYLYSLEQFGIKFGLDNIRAILAALDHPEDTFRSVHIAGTNGKGSVTAMVEAALHAAGCRSARYTSPHLIDLTERFVINGEPVTTEELSAVVGLIRDVVTQLMAARSLDVHPTFFEVTTAAAFELFRRALVELAVCEVGLGGRLDATNVLSPMVTAITSIDFDHEVYLGRTLASIAGEKAGIIKPGVPVVVGEVDDQAADVIRRTAQERQAPLIWAKEGVDVDVDRTNADGRQSMTVRTPVRRYGPLELALAGSHQMRNAIVALRVLESLEEAGVPMTPESIVSGLTTVRWPGRLQRMTFDAGRSALLDAAHNPAGARALAAFLGRERRHPLVFAAMRDKDAREILRALLPSVSAVVLTRASNPRSADPALLSELARSLAPDVRIIVTDSPRTALAEAWQLSPEIVIAGSIFLLGDVMRELDGTAGHRAGPSPGLRPGGS